MAPAEPRANCRFNRVPMLPQLRFRRGLMVNKLSITCQLSTLLVSGVPLYHFFTHSLISLVHSLTRSPTHSAVKNGLKEAARSGVGWSSGITPPNVAALMADAAKGDESSLSSVGDEEEEDEEDGDGAYIVFVITFSRRIAKTVCRRIMSIVWITTSLPSSPRR